MLEHLSTEKRNQKSMALDKMSPLEFCTFMNEEDINAAVAVQQALPTIAKIIELVATRLKDGGRLIYMGSGTSGRMGVIDAVELIPTFGIEDGIVIGLIAGGDTAFVKAVEGAEDSFELAVEDLKKINLTNKDVVFGLAASGRTPYSIAGLDYATEIGASTVALSCNTNAVISKHAMLAVEVDAGPEVLTGSTRLKAGTMQKLILNMISTGVMVQLGKVYQNLMVDVKMTNEKLRERGKRIVMEATACDYETAAKTLGEAQQQVKVAIVMILRGLGYEDAVESLEATDGFIERAIEL